MARHPSLIRRPVIDTGTALLVGFDPDRYAEELLGKGP
jgi:arsenate reductase